MASKNIVNLLRIIVLTAVYFGAASLSFELAYSARQVTAVWAPTGIALAALMLFGRRIWPAITVGAFLANSLNGVSLPGSVVIAIGNTLEPLLGAYLLKDVFGVKPSFPDVRQVLALFLVAPVVTALSASIGTSVLAQTGVIPWSAYNSTWLTWWTGDLHGALIVAPLVMVWFSQKGIPVQIKRRPLEALALFATVLLVSLIIFTPANLGLNINFPTAYLTFPVIIWSALRFQQPGAITTVLMIALTAIWGTINGQGPFAASASLDLNLTYLHLLIFVATATGLIVSAVVDEQKRVERELRRTALEMEDLLRQNREMEAQLKEANKRATGILTRILEESLEPLPLEDKNGQN
jgi:two-component system, NarL family, sensor histidine kinase FusK